MSISNVRFLDGDNYCYVCAAKIDNKRLKFIIDDAIRYEHRPEFQSPIRPDDPIIESESTIFCSPKCFIIGLTDGN
jgi:hypothetical protein